MLSSTFSPEDNKLRLYSTSRLDAETYQRVKAAGFIWAAKQDLFVAPAWSPEREDLLLELCGEIGDEDTSLAERAVERADRFSDYQESRSEDAERAQAAVHAIADGIPLGQPILVSHHSERHARRDAQKIEDGMRRAVKMWETAEYWKSRAAGAIRHAKYKERADVRYRRIKGLEAEKRKCERNRDGAAKFLRTYQDPEAATAKLRDGRELLPALLKTYEGGLSFEDQTRFEKGLVSFEDALAQAIRNLSRTVTINERWIGHLSNRIEYERAMLGDTGEVQGEKFAIEVGGKVQLRSGGWALVLRVNRKDGRIVSVRTDSRYVAVRGIEEIADYQPPSTEEAEKVKAAMKLPPIVNYPGPGFLHMTKAEHDASVPKWSDFPKIGHVSATETVGAHRVRQTRTPGQTFWNKTAVYLTDIKRIDPPAAKENAA